MSNNYDEALHFCENNTSEVIARQMSRDMDEIDRLRSQLSKIGHDAEAWGGALNEASWTFIEAYRRVTGQPEPALLFNNCKTMLRDAILKYVEIVSKEN